MLPSSRTARSWQDTSPGCWGRFQLANVRQHRWASRPARYGAPETVAPTRPIAVVIFNSAPRILRRALRRFVFNAAAESSQVETVPSACESLWVWRAMATSLLVVGCGRVGFDPHDADIAGAGDAADDAAGPTGFATLCNFASLTVLTDGQP